MKKPYFNFEKSVMGAKEFLLKMRCKTVDLETMKNQGAPLTIIEKEAFLFAVHEIINEDILPEGTYLEVSSDFRKIKKCRPFDKKILFNPKGQNNGSKQE